MSSGRRLYCRTTIYRRIRRERLRLGISFVGVSSIAIPGTLETEIIPSEKPDDQVVRDMYPASSVEAIRNQHGSLDTTVTASSIPDAVRLFSIHAKSLTVADLKLLITLLKPLVPELPLDLRTKKPVSFGQLFIISTDSYEKARRYEQRAELESEFASTDAPDVDVPILKKRIRRPRKMSSSEDENINLNPPPGGLFAYSPLKEINVVNRGVSVVSPGPSLPFVEKLGGSSERHPLEKQISELRTDNRELKELLHKSLDKLITLEVMMNNVMAYINSSPTPPSQPTVSYSHGKFHLPMRDLEIFLKINNDMDNEEVYKDFIRTLAVVHRGRTVDECTRKICNYVFAKSLAMKINWLGTNGKCRLMDTNISQAIINAVLCDRNYPQESEGNVKHFIMRWFQGAKDRDGGRSKRRYSETNRKQGNPELEDAKKSLEEEARRKHEQVDRVDLDNHE